MNQEENAMTATTSDQNLESIWTDGKRREAAPAPLNGRELQAIIASRVRKQFRTVSQFVWAALAYQIILYSFLTRTLVRHWGDGAIPLLCLAGAALYAPVTVAFLRRVRALFGRASDGSGLPASDVFHYVEGEYRRLADFFRFKQRLDWIGIPISCAIIVLVTFTLFVDGGVAGHPVGGLVLFALWVGMSVLAVRAENKKRFTSPLRHLELVLDDLTRP